jgi:hypothetical protein
LFNADFAAAEKRARQESLILYVTSLQPKNARRWRADTWAIAFESLILRIKSHLHPVMAVPRSRYLKPACSFIELASVRELTGSLNGWIEQES